MTNEKKVFLTVPGIYADYKVSLLETAEKPEGEFRVLITFLDPIYAEKQEDQSLERFEIGPNDYLSSVLNLNHKELEILRLLQKGMRNQEIADMVGLNVGTVRNYLSRMMEKVNVKNRTQLIMKAIEMGMLNEE